MNVKGAGREVLVVGLGVSGRAAAELALRRGFPVVATDAAPRERFGGALDALEAAGCRLALGGHRPEDFTGAALMVVSPGVPLDLPEIAAARAAGVQVVGELEWAWRDAAGIETLAVTGTNGKTTTTTLLGAMLREAGRRTFTGGNLGTPLSAWVLSGDPADALVLEVSSFQLDTAQTFSPRVAVLLNITDDHLDRYEGFSAYADSKFSVFARQTPRDFAVVNGADPAVRERLARIPSRVLAFSRRDPSAHAFVSGGRAVVRLPGEAAFHLDFSACALTGVHNEENILAAALAASAVGAPPEAIAHALASARPLPHRMERVATVSRVRFVNDSKGTNAGATAKALESVEGPVLLLAGGRDKLGSYAPLLPLLREKGRGAFLFGEAASRMAEELSVAVPVMVFPNLSEAFAEAVSRAGAGDTVLLSPACASFDQYGSYGERGEHFRRLVRALGTGDAP